MALERYDYEDYGRSHVLSPAGTPLPSGPLGEAESTVGNPYRYTGRRFDPESGLYWYRTRYYDPRAGRFTSRDTIGIWGDPANLGNGYTYVGNSPWTFVDPWGLDTQSEAGGDDFYGLIVGREELYPYTYPGFGDPFGDLGGNGYRTTTTTYVYVPVHVYVGTVRSGSSGTSHGGYTGFRAPMDWARVTDAGFQRAINRLRGSGWDFRYNGIKLSTYLGMQQGFVHSVLTFGANSAYVLQGYDAHGELGGLDRVLLGVEDVGTALSALSLGSMSGLLLTGRGTASAFGGLSQAGQFGIRPYNQLRKAIMGSGLKAHHVIEKRFALVMGQNAREMASVAVTRAEHQAFTNAWRTRIPYGPSGTGAATKESVMQAAREIYAGYPAILRALGL